MANDLLLRGAGLAAGAAAFDPGALSPALWLKADAGTFQTSGGSPATADADPVGEWQDQSGNGRHFAQATGSKKPTLKLAIQNGKPVIRFDGTDDSLSTASLVLSTFVGSNVATLFFLMKQNSAKGQNTAFAIPPALGTNSVSSYMTYDNVIYYDYGDSAGGGRLSASQPAGWDDAFHAVEVYRSGSTGEVKVDGVTVVSGTFTDVLDATASGVFQLSSDDGLAFMGDFGEVLVWPSALSAGDRASMLAYFQGRWGTP